MTATETETMQPLPAGYEAEAPILPRIACIGNVTEIGDGHPSSNNPDLYIVQPFLVSPLQSGRTAKGNLTFHPEFFRSGFTPDSLTDDAIKFVFASNIARENRVTTLRGLCGSETAFRAVLAGLMGLAEVTAESVTEYLRSTILPETVVGYILQERRDKTGEYDSQGRAVRKRSGFYEIGEWFYPDGDGLKRVIAIANAPRRANRAPTILAFEV